MIHARMTAIVRFPAQSPAPRDDEVARLRVPPHSIEAEQSVLGGLLLDNLAWDRAGDLLTDSDFYRHEHRLIYAAIGALVDASKPADVITVFEQLQGLGKAARLRRPGLPERAGAERAERGQHAPLRRDRARARDPAQADRRQRRDRDQRLQPAGPRGQQILDEAESKIFKIGEEGSRQKQGFQGIDKLVVSLIDRVNELHENGAEEVTGVRTGFYDLDRMTAGLQKGDLIVLAARPSMGKTAFALNIAEHVAVQEGLPVLVFSMEMGASQLALRMVGSLGRIDQQHLRTGALDDDEWERLTEAVDRLGQVQLFIDETAGADSSAELRARARRMARQFGGTLGLIVIDYLQLMSGSSGERREPRHRDRRDLARAEGAGQGTAVPGDRAVAAEPQRRVAHRQAADDERPARVGRDRAGRRRHHVHLPRRLLQQGVSKEPGVAEIIIGKQRNGPIGTRAS